MKRIAPTVNPGQQPDRHRVFKAAQGALTVLALAVSGASVAMAAPITAQQRKEAGVDAQPEPKQAEAEPGA